MRPRPVRLRSRVPVWKEHQHAIRRILPVHRQPRCAHACAAARTAQQRQHRALQLVRQIEKDALHPRRHPPQPAQASAQERRLIHTRKRHGVKVHRDQRDAVLLTGHPRAIARARRDHQIRASTALDRRQRRHRHSRRRGEVDHRPLTSRPKSRITRHRADFIRLPHRHKRQPRRPRLLRIAMPRDHRHPMPPRQQLPPQPDVRKHIARAAEWKEKDVHAVK